jgi:hypothetical protein
MYGLARAALYVLIPIAGLRAWSAWPDQVTLLPASSLWVEGKSTIRDWKCTANSVQADIEVRGEDPIRRLMAGENSVGVVEFSLATAGLDCANNTMNEHMKKALKAEQHAKIAFTVDSYELKLQDGNRRGTLVGNLSLGGARKAIAVDVAFSLSEEGILRVTGTHALTMTDYGLKPPSLMLGTMKVRDNVLIGFDLLLANK